MLRLVIVLLIGLAGMAQAQGFEVMSQGNALGKVIASEEYCGLSFDQTAISGWVDANIPAEAMDFPQYLDMGIAAETYEQDARSGSAKTAHCAAIRRTAAHFDFIAD